MGGVIGCVYRSTPGDETGGPIPPQPALFCQRMAQCGSGSMQMMTRCGGSSLIFSVRRDAICECKGEAGNERAA